MFLQNFDPVTNTLLTPQIVSKTSNFVAGTGYSMNGNVATTAGGSGTGLTVDILEVNSAGAIQEFVIDDPGDGNYAIGETVTITGGDGNSTFTLVVLEQDASPIGERILFCILCIVCKVLGMSCQGRNMGCEIVFRLYWDFYRL